MSRDKLIESIELGLELYISGGRDLRAAAEAALTALENVGMVVVPVEPTEGMTKAGYVNSNRQGSARTNYAAVYRAMIAARPVRTEEKE